MADEDDDREVLTSLPRSRPTRRSSKRAQPANADGADAPARAGPAKPAPSPTRARPAKPTASAQPPEPPAAAERPEPAKPTPAAKRPKPGPSARPKRAKPASAPSGETTDPPKAAPERKVPPAGYAAPDGGDQDGSPGATEILSTAIQAATELTQIAFSVGRQALQAAFDRLPKP